MIFTYQCIECCAIIEHEKGMQDPHPATLPHDDCNGPVRHVFQSCGIHYRGKGFFKTDAELRRLDGQMKSDSFDGEGLDIYDQTFGVRNSEEQ